MSVANLTSHHTLPPFSDQVKTAPIVSISLAKLEAGDVTETDAWWDASKQLGFFYLSLEGSELGVSLVTEAEKLNVLQKHFFALPNEEKERFRGDLKTHSIFTYRYNDIEEKDGNGVAKRNQSYNIRKDYLFGIGQQRPLHPLILDNLSLFQSWARHCHQVVEVMLSLYERYLELPAGTLLDIHRFSRPAGDHIRLRTDPSQVYDEQRVSRGEHTDLGSITVLFNWLSGLQIRLPDTTQWVWVKPQPGSCVVNLGDAMVNLTAGILRSNIHRVAPTTGPQAGLARTSLVYFARPEDNILMTRLKGGIIDMQPADEEIEEEINCSDWVIRRNADLAGIFTKKGGFEHRQFPDINQFPDTPNPVAVK